MGSPELRAAPAQRAAAEKHTRATERAPTRPGASGAGERKSPEMPSQGAAAAPHGHGERRRSSGRPAPRLSGAGSPSPHGRFRSSRPAAGAEGRGRALRQRRAGPPNRARTPIGGAAAGGGPTEGDAQGRGAAVRVSARPMLAPWTGVGAGYPRPGGFSLRLQPAKAPPRTPT